MRLLVLGSVALFSFVISMQAQEEAARPPKDEMQITTLDDVTTALSDLKATVPMLTGLVAVNAIGLFVLSAALWNTRKIAQAHALTRASELTPHAVDSKEVLNRARLLGQAADLALQGEHTDAVMDRARLVKQFYGDLLPDNFVERVKKIAAEDAGPFFTEAPFGTTLRKDVIQLLAQYPNQRGQILDDFKSVFPYAFLDKLEAAHRKIRAHSS